MGTGSRGLLLVSDRVRCYRSERKKAVTVSGDAKVIHSDPGILGGTPVFVGTRVPAKALLDYLKAGHSLDEFLDDFPTVSREQAIAALELAERVLIDGARAA